MPTDQQNHQPRDNNIQRNIYRRSRPLDKSGKDNDLQKVRGRGNRAGEPDSF